MNVLESIKKFKDEMVEGQVFSFLREVQTL